MKPHLLLLLLGALAWQPDIAIAQKTAKAAPDDPTGDPMLLTAGFLSSHPDLRYRLLGLDERKRGNHENAFRFFQRAAHYADKPSQAMVAEMLWNGQGTPEDRPLAYAWMDLAAERGYRGFVPVRERYWSDLSEEQRDRAVAEGEAVYSRYGDAVAQPRIATILRRERRRTTGSRTGAVGSLKIIIPGPSGEEQIDGSKFYDPKYWDPEKYQAWHDSIWMRPRVERVDVGEVEQVHGTDQPRSRVPLVAPDKDAVEPSTPERDETGLGTRPTPQNPR